MQNKHNLPEWLVQTIDYVNSKYNPGEKTHYSATSLLKPPYLKQLEAEHKDELDRDPADSLSSFVGSSVHNSIEAALEKNDDYIVEERFYREIDGFVISGQIDLYEKKTKTLSDHKANSVYKLYKSDDHFDFEAQLAVNRWLLAAAGHEVERIYINGFIVDWRSSEAKRDKEYPQTRFMRIDLPMWSLEDTENFIRERVRLHEQAKQGLAPHCNERDRWAKASTYAVMKVGRKSAVRVLDSEGAALQMAGELGKGHSVEHRPGGNTRCEGYCAVNKWCSFYQSTYGE